MHPRRSRPLRGHFHLVRLPGSGEPLSRPGAVLLADSARFRKVIAGWSLRLSPLCFAVAALLRPDWTDDERELLARLDADGGSELAACLLGLAGCGLAIPAVLGLMHMLRERWTAPGHVAGAVALAGVGGLAVHYAIELVIWQMAQPDAQRGRTVRVLGETMSDPVITGAFQYLPLAFGAGIVALGIILRLADAVEPWTAYFLVAGIGAATAGLFLHDPTTLKVGWGFALAGSNRIGRRVLAQNREDWDHWPSWTFEWTWRR